MNFQPVLPLSGYAGWSFLQRTRETQQEAFANSAEVQRDTEYFKSRIADIQTASDLVADRRLLAVALGAFGLNDDINNKYFIQTVLEDGTLDEEALANRLSDKRYLALSKAFGFGDFAISNTQLSDFPDKIISRYQDKQFEVAVGNQDADLRLAMSVESELSEILARDTSDDGKWFAILGSPALRNVFEKAFGLPATFGAIDIDLQLSTFQEKSGRIFGSQAPDVFSSVETQDRLISLFLARSQISGGAGLSSQNVALTLLQNAQPLI